MMKTSLIELVDPVVSVDELVEHSDRIEDGLGLPLRPTARPILATVPHSLSVQTTLFQHSQLVRCVCQLKS